MFQLPGNTTCAHLHIAGRDMENPSLSRDCDRVALASRSFSLCFRDRSFTAASVPTPDFSILFSPSAVTDFFASLVLLPRPPSGMGGFPDSSALRPRPVPARLFPGEHAAFPASAVAVSSPSLLSRPRPTSFCPSLAREGLPLDASLIRSKDEH